MINFAPFISLLLNKKTKREPKRELSTQDKKELKKINEMDMFEAMDYLSKNKDMYDKIKELDEEERITYCGACGGDASVCDGC
jgi:hypothetical protein